MEACSSVVKVLRQYVNVMDVTKQPSSQRDTQLSQENHSAMDTSECAVKEILSGTVSQQQVAQVSRECHHSWVCFTVILENIRTISGSCVMYGN